MFKHSIVTERNVSDFTLNFLCMMYVVMAILSLLLFGQIISFKFFSFPMEVSGAVIPYVFLYPISFIVLRIYGLRYVNNMIISMLLVFLLFVLMATVVVKFSSIQTGINDILIHSGKMFVIGLFGMPA